MAGSRESRSGAYMSIQASSSGGKKYAAVLLCRTTQLTGAARRGRTTRSLQELCAGKWHPYVCKSRSMRAGVEAHGAYHPVCLRVAGGVLGRGNLEGTGSASCYAYMIQLRYFISGEFET